MRQRATTLKLVVVAVGVVGAGVLAWRSLVHRQEASDAARSSYEQTARTWFEEGQAEFAKLEMRDAATLADVGAVREALGRVLRPPPAPAGVGSADDLMKQVAEFVYYAFVQDSYPAYREWRRSQGDSLLPAATLEDFWMVKTGIYPYVMKKPWAPGMDSEAAFEDLWNWSRSPAGRASRIKGIASQPRGGALMFGELTREDPRTRLTISGEMPAEVWRGVYNATHPNWWMMPDVAQRLALSSGKADYAEVGLIMEFGDGARHPLVMTWHWQPSAGRWRLLHLCSYNCSEKMITYMVY